MKRWTKDKGWHDPDLNAVYEPGLGWARRDGVVSIPDKGFVYWDEVDEGLKGKAQAAVKRAQGLFPNTNVSTPAKPTTSLLPAPDTSNINPFLTPLDTSQTDNSGQNMIDYKQLLGMLKG